MHLTLLQDAATPPAKSPREQLDRFRAFQRLYNEERPHQALGNATPAEHYQAWSRRWDGVLREPDYPEDQEVRRVRSNGEIKWQGRLVYINCALAGEPVGLAEGDDGAWRVSYGPLALGVIAHGGDRLRKPKPAGCGLVDNAARRLQGPQPLQQHQTGTERELCHPYRRSDLLPMFPVAHIPAGANESARDISHDLRQRSSSAPAMSSPGCSAG